MLLKNCRKILPLALLFCLLAVPGWGAETGDEERPVLDDSSTIEDYLAYAALNNPGLEAAFLRWQAAVEGTAQAGTLPDPRFTYGYFIREVETRVGPQRHRFGVSQSFPWSGTRQLRRDAAALAAEAERQRYEAAKLDLFRRVKLAFHEYAYLARAIEITGESVELMTWFERAARARYKVGSANHADIIKAQVELARLEDRLVSLRDRLQPAATKLNSELNRERRAPLPLPGPGDDGPVAIDEAALYAAIGEAPRLEVINKSAEREQVAAELARKGLYPGFTVSLEYLETGSALDPSTPDSGKDPLMAMVSVNIPLWRESSRAAEREARARENAALLRREEEQNRLGAKLDEALFALRDAERKIALYGGSLLPKAHQSLEVTQKAYSAGKAGFIDLVDAQRTLLDFRLAREQAVADRAVRLAEIEEIAGVELPRGGLPPDSRGRDDNLRDDRETRPGDALTGDTAANGRETRPGDPPAGPVAVTDHKGENQ